jgi:preprotein translocase subunit SecG
LLIALQIVQIIISVSLVTVILLQGGRGGLGSVFGGSGSVYRTRRGAEKLLFQVTIGLAAAFFLVSVIMVVLPG